jgi:hypothetical protein
MPGVQLWIRAVINSEGDAVDARRWIDSVAPGTDNAEVKNRVRFKIAVQDLWHRSASKILAQDFQSELTT